MKRSENRYFFSYLYQMSLLETIEFIFCNDTSIEYGDRMIVILDNDKCHVDDEDEAIGYHGVAGKC